MLSSTYLPDLLTVPKTVNQGLPSFQLKDKNGQTFSIPKCLCLGKPFFGLSKTIGNTMESGARVLIDPCGNIIWIPEGIGIAGA